MPKMLVDQVEAKTKSSPLGYHSIAQFVSEAIRKQLLEMDRVGEKQ